ncbi:MAG: ABC transporter ATP-binding protein [Candidatus Binatus sp.]|uniref:ABC transporter ATP-binding protein n=3 Tax=Candidatus Binatus sp. TaxID=2811406 RepID=UPI003BC1E69A
MTTPAIVASKAHAGRTDAIADSRMSAPPKSTLRTYFAMLAHVSRWHLVGVVAVAVLFSLTEGVGIALLLPTLQVAGFNMAGQGEAGRYAAMLSNAFVAMGVRPSLIILLAVFVTLVGARTVLGQIQSVGMYAVQQEVEHHMRRRLYHAIADANWLFVCRSRASDFTHALTHEIYRIGSGTNLALVFTGEIVLLVLYMTIAFALSAGMTGLVLVSGALLTFVFRGRTHAIQEQGEEVSSTNKSLYSATIEHLQSLKAAKTYGAEERNFSIYSHLSADVVRANVDGARQQAIAATWFELGSVVILAVVLYVSIKVLAVSPAAILILLLLFARVMPRIMTGQQHYRAFVNSLPSFKNLLNIEARCAAAAEPAAHPHDRMSLTRELAADHLSFAYSEGRVAAVRDLSLVIPAGKVVALVGPSGAGKSTIADILMGLVQPDSGTLRLDGRPLGPEGVRGWRDQIGYVAPDTFLFHDTIRANLKWARPEASEDEMLAALRQASVFDFVAGLKDGLDTVVGDRGMMLSQGERQRLALARAFLRRPSMLILDEATNSLDSENEGRVLDAIESRRGELTVVLIAHRLSTIRWADLIYVVEGGQVVESGDWSSLSAIRDGRFRALWEAQSLTI